MGEFTSTGDGYSKVCSVNSSEFVEVAGLSRDPGGNVAIWQDANVTQQHWAATPTGDGHCLLINRFSGMALGVAGNSTADGANVEQQTYESQTQQQWRTPLPSATGRVPGPKARPGLDLPGEARDSHSMSRPPSSQPCLASARTKAKLRPLAFPP
ncbi:MULTISPECIES: RICIN domain-containing protein [Streptomyces]|uniref:RICIN domain-containing protein n=2 Tax=Streptomyces TaxID=1883 RepID=A0ABV9JA18_9ACTN